LGLFFNSSLGIVIHFNGESLVLENIRSTLELFPLI
jgi:hypothetical protein